MWGIVQDHKIFKVQKSINDNQISFDIPTLKYLIVLRVNKFFPISKLWVCSLPQMVTLVTSAYLRNHTCRMHLLHLRSVKWGPPLSKVGTCSKFSLFRKRGIFRQLARYICQPFTSDALSYPFHEISMLSQLLLKKLGTYEKEYLRGIYCG